MILFLKVPIKRLGLRRNCFLLTSGVHDVKKNRYRENLKPGSDLKPRKPQHIVGKIKQIFPQ